MKKVKIAAFLAVFAASCTHVAYAAHPLATDDTGTQGKNNNQIEINTDRVRDTAGSSHVAALTYTYGWSDDIDVYMTAPFAFSPTRGWSDIEIGGKWRFYERDNSSLAVVPHITLANGSEQKGLGNGKEGGGLALIASHFIGPWGLHANLGMQINRFRYASDKETNWHVVWRVSTAAGYAVNQRWTAVADVGVEQNSDKTLRPYGSYVILGAIYSPSNTLDIDIGTRFGSRGADISRQIGVGLTWRF